MTTESRSALLGRWRIVHMDEWDEDYLDLVVPAFIKFDKKQDGQFQFGTVRGWLDVRFGTRDDQPLVEFSWEGENDTDPACGRGWAVLRGERLEGHLYIHTGDDSAFVALRPAAAGKERGEGASTRRRRAARRSRGRPR